MTRGPLWCPVFTPTRAEFERPFMDYVREVFEKDPELSAFKVVPPPGWKARRRCFPDLKAIQIAMPIRQHVFGTKGAFRCILVENKSLNAQEFKDVAKEEESAVPAIHKKLEAAVEFKQNAELSADDLMEREFWNSVTINPPLYGADTDLSFFDPKLGYGWNLRNLGDLLQQVSGVPSICGVTSPMTYFGMWRSFFGWHKEDSDLQSINFLHWGAPKVWYCVSPKDREKFERMAENTFPGLHKDCPAFIRHKDVLLSPTTLHTHGITYMQAKQYPGEFIVLNSAAYHCGFNLGFNCAEAINFATPEWVPVGKAAVPCKCAASNGGVHISMRLFDPKWVDTNEPLSSSSEEEEEEEDEDSSDSNEEEEEEEEATTYIGHHHRNKAAAKKLAPASLVAKSGGVKRMAGAVSKVVTGSGRKLAEGVKKLPPHLIRAGSAAAGGMRQRMAPSRKAPLTQAGQSGAAKKLPTTATPKRQAPAAHTVKSVNPKRAPTALRRAPPGHHLKPSAGVKKVVGLASRRVSSLSLLSSHAASQPGSVTGIKAVVASRLTAVSQAAMHDSMKGTAPSKRVPASALAPQSATARRAALTARLHPSSHLSSSQLSVRQAGTLKRAPLAHPGPTADVRSAAAALKRLSSHLTRSEAVEKVVVEAVEKVVVAVENMELSPHSVLRSGSKPLANVAVHAAPTLDGNATAAGADGGAEGGDAADHGDGEQLPQVTGAVDVSPTLDDDAAGGGAEGGDAANHGVGEQLPLAPGTVNSSPTLDGDAEGSGVADDGVGEQLPQLPLATVAVNVASTLDDGAACGGAEGGGAADDGVGDQLPQLPLALGAVNVASTLDDGAACGGAADGGVAGAAAADDGVSGAAAADDVGVAGGGETAGGAVDGAAGDGGGAGGGATNGTAAGGGVGKQLPRRPLAACAVKVAQTIEGAAEGAAAGGAAVGGISMQLSQLPELPPADGDLKVAQTVEGGAAGGGVSIHLPLLPLANGDVKVAPTVEGGAAVGGVNMQPPQLPQLPLADGDVKVAQTVEFGAAGVGVSDQLPPPPQLSRSGRVLKTSFRLAESLAHPTEQEIAEDRKSPWAVSSKAAAAAASPVVASKQTRGSVSAKSSPYVEGRQPARGSMVIPPLAAPASTSLLVWPSQAPDQHSTLDALENTLARERVVSTKAGRVVYPSSRMVESLDQSKFLAEAADRAKLAASDRKAQAALDRLKLLALVEHRHERDAVRTKAGRVVQPSSRLPPSPTLPHAPVMVDDSLPKGVVSTKAGRVVQPLSRLSPPSPTRQHVPVVVDIAPSPNALAWLSHLPPLSLCLLDGTLPPRGVDSTCQEGADPLPKGAVSTKAGRLVRPSCRLNDSTAQPRLLATLEQQQGSSGRGTRTSPARSRVLAALDTMRGSDRSTRAVGGVRALGQKRARDESNSPGKLDAITSPEAWNATTSTEGEEVCAEPLLSQPLYGGPMESEPLLESPLSQLLLSEWLQSSLLQSGPLQSELPQSQPLQSEPLQREPLLSAKLPRTEPRQAAGVLP